MRTPSPRNDLIVFVAVLLTGVVLIICRVRPEAVSTIAIGLSTLYAAWQRANTGNQNTRHISPETDNPGTSHTDSQTDHDTRRG